jgi:hypothetical protein
VWENFWVKIPNRVKGNFPTVLQANDVYFWRFMVRSLRIVYSGFLRRGKMKNAETESWVGAGDGSDGIGCRMWGRK